jgi:Asp-tRNA(Asn)/Glu-tRNA(Gln) amidotransferase C subunit
MAHPSLDEMIARMRAAREAGSANEASPEQLQRLRELARDCPAFTPNLLELARLLRLTDEPEVEMEQALEEIEQLLEQAVQASGRGAPALLELAHFVDVFRRSPARAEALFEESVASALRALENSWAGLIEFWAMEMKKDSLEKALKLAELAERVFPESSRIFIAVEDARQYAASAGLLPPREG